MIEIDKVDHEILKAFCCPACHSSYIQVNGQLLTCKVCDWHSSLTCGDTISFIPVDQNDAYNGVPEGIQTETARNQRFGWVKTLHSRLVPWKRWIFRDMDYWRKAIHPVRLQEIDTAKKLLVSISSEPFDLLLELGVGFQDHIDLYTQFSHHAISSDIYRDPDAVRIYRDTPSVLYCLIDVEQLPIRESSIDLLFTSHVVEHFPNRKKNLNSLHRAMKPGAVACHIVPISFGFLLGHMLGTLANALVLLPRIGRGVHGEYDSIRQELQQTTLSSWRKLFEECGFDILLDAPGALGLTPVRPKHTLWLSKRLHIYGSWVFVMKVLR